ncbi:MAG: NAD kinase [Culicoidibacterales bacterium]
MKFVIVKRSGSESHEIHETIQTRLESCGFQYDEELPELIISVGGDGTLLEAFQRYKHRLADVKFVGVHTGSLGFYTDWKIDEIDEMLECIIANEFETMEFPLVEFELYGICGERKQVVLNEFVLTNAKKTLAIDVFIDDVYFESFRGTGLCVSTPSGSTAYNKSLHGALLHPRIKAFQLSEIASINNRVYRTISSSIILAQDQILKLKIKDSQGVVLTYDHLEETFLEIDYILARLSPETIRFARYKKRQFWERVRDSFI